MIRITPAGAGKTLGMLYLRYILKDHPRRCGENRSVCFMVDGDAGSPPQVRGKLRSRDARTLPFGITPAGAGKT